jgi:hypothetical protein
MHSSNTSAMSEPSACLDGHRRLRAHEALRAVDVGAEADAVLLDAEDRAEPLLRAARPLISSATGPVPHREDLEAARVGDHGSVPAHEAAHPAEALDQLGPRREEEVERVRENHLEAELRGLGDLERLHDRLGRERHERRRVHLAMREAQRAGAGARAGVARADREGRRQARRRKAEGPPERALAGG